MKALIVVLLVVGSIACGPIHLEGAASLSVGDGQRISKSLKSSVEHVAKEEAGEEVVEPTF
jgi:hypothetical protein